MTEAAEKYLLARVDIPASESLQAVADRLSRLMPGFTLEEEVTGRYDEVPAFVAERDDMEFILFGIPDDGSVGEYELKFRCETNLPIETLLARDAGGFLRQFVSEKPLSEGGCLNFSDELARCLVELGIPGCKPIVPVT